MKVLVTGAAGFIGFHLCSKLLERGDEVVGVDNFCDIPYDNRLKRERAKRLKITLFELDCAEKLPKEVLNVDAVCHLAATAGVRHSLERPLGYIHSNVLAFTNLLESFKQNGVNFVFASSSSVYGDSKVMPFKEDWRSDRPISLYAATKRSDELIAYSYHAVYNMPITALRFFSVYGPWGRPDMALYIFTKNILRGLPIPVYNNGEMARDWTYVDDIVDGVIRCLDKPASYDVVNIGYGQPQKLMDFIHQIESCCGKKAIINFLPMQSGDVVSSHADIQKISNLYGYSPKTNMIDGVKITVDWFMCHRDLI